MVITLSLCLTWAWFGTGSWRPRQTDGQTDIIPIANTRSQQFPPVQLSRVKKLSEEANSFVRPLPCSTNSDPLRPTIFPQTGVLTAPPNTCIVNCGQTASVAAWLLLTAYRNWPAPYPTVPSSTPYGHLFSENRGPDHLKHCMFPCSTVGYSSDSWASPLFKEPAGTF